MFLEAKHDSGELLLFNLSVILTRFKKLSFLTILDWINSPHTIYMYSNSKTIKHLCKKGVLSLYWL